MVQSKFSDTYDNMNIQGQTDLIAESWNIIKDGFNRNIYKGKVSYST